MSLNKSQEDNENIEKDKKQDNINLKEKFVKDFVKEKFDSSDKNSFIDSAMKSDDITSINGLKTDIQKFKAYNDEFSDLNLSEINIFNFKKAIGKEYVKLNNTRLLLKEKILKDYSISGDGYDLLLKGKVEKINDLDELIKNDKKLYKFLDDSLEKVPLKRENIFPIMIGSLSDEEKQKRLDNLEPADKKQDIIGVLYDISTMRIIDSDIRMLFETNLFTKKEKKELVATFIPYITLKQAVDIGFITKEESEKKKKQIVKYSYEGLTNETYNELLKTLNLDDIKISSSEFIKGSNNIDLLAKEVGFRNLEDDFREIKNEAEEKIKENGPQTLNDLSNELNRENKFNNLNKFSEGNIMEISKKTENGKTETIYVKILKSDDDKKELTILEIGKNNTINLTQQGEGKQISYLKFFKNSKNSANKLDFFTEEDIKEKIKDPVNNLESSDLEFFTKEDISNLDDLQKQRYKNFYKEKLQKDLDLLNDELEQNGGEENESPLLKARIEDLEKQIGNVSNLENNDLLSFLNFNKLLEKIDNIDQDGKKLGLKKGDIIETKKWSYEISGIEEENQIIYLKSDAGLEKMTFEDFYRGFENQEGKRKEKIKDFSQFLSIFQEGENSKNWEKYEFKNGSLCIKELEDEDKSEKKEVEFFISDKEDSIIKIDNISQDKITVQFGERKNIKDLDKKDKNYNKDSDEEILYIKGAERKTYTLDEFQKIISDPKYGYKPSFETGKNKKEKQEEELQNKIEGSFMSRYFDRISFAELLAGGKMFIESIEETLKKGNDLHAAKAALAMGKFLPDEMKAELQIKVERAESEQMDKELENLGKVESAEAIERVRKWLLNKDTPEFKKEAGLMFMVSKYGVLYAKKPLGNKAGSFLWYEAFGGRVNDKLYLEVKADAEAGDPPIPFTEERLMYMLLNKQCKGIDGYNGIKRRGRLYKEYDGKISQGITDELEKGSKEAKSMRSFKDRNNGAKGEFKGGEFNNAIGKYKEAVNRGASLDKLNEFPFTVLFSGGCYLLQEDQLEEFKKFTEGKFGGLIFTKFLSDSGGMKLFNQTILDLSKEFGIKDPNNFSLMNEEAEAIFKNQNNSNLSLKEKMEKTELFWSKYGKALTRTMLNLNDQDSSYAKTDKILLSEKKQFSAYNETLDAYVESAIFSDEESMNDQFSKQGISGLGYKVFDDIGGLSADARFRHNEAAEKILNEMTGEIKNTQTYDYSNDKTENTNIKLLNLEKQLSSLFIYIKKNGGQSKTMENMIGGTSYWGDFTRLGISNYIKMLDGDKFSIDNLKNLDTPEVKKFIRGVAEDILSGNTQSSTNSSSLFNEIISGTTKAVNDNIHEEQKIA